MKISSSSQLGQSISLAIALALTSIGVIVLMSLASNGF